MQNEETVNLEVPCINTSAIHKAWKQMSRGKAGEDGLSTNAGELAMLYIMCLQT